VVVALDKTEYVQKMETLLSDTETHKLLTHNSVNKMLTQLKTLLKEWKQRGFVENSLYNKLNASNPVAPLAYCLPKIYKVGYSLRVIVSSVGSPFYNLASFLNDILHDSIPVANSFIKNNFHLTKHISNLTISNNEVILFP